MWTSLAVFAQVVARNIAPLAGILVLGWDAANVLLLYAVDTALVAVVIVVALAGDALGRSGPSTGTRTAPLLVVPVAILLVAITLPFVVGREFDWRDALADPAVRYGAMWQALAALGSCAGLVRALRRSTPEQLRLERRFGLVLSRWLTTAFLAWLGLAERIGPDYGGAALVAAYVVLSIWSDVAPHHFAAFADEDGEARASRPGSTRAQLRRARRNRGRGP